MSTSRVVRLGVLAASVLVLTSCAAGPNDGATGVADLAGFWLGLWHGLISPITFVISLFTSDVSIYEVHNNGNWYDFGFILGVATAFSGAAGSGSAARRNRPARPSTTSGD